MLARGPRRSCCPADRSRCTRRARRSSTPASSTPACRCSASATASRRWRGARRRGPPYRALASSAAPRCGQRGRHAAGRHAGRAPGLDEPRRRGRRRAEGFTVLAVHRRRPRWRRSSGLDAGTPACSGTPRCCTASTASAVLERFLVDIAGLPADLDDGQRRRRAGRAGSASRSATSRPSVVCPAASTRRSRRRSCSGRSVTS